MSSGGNVTVTFDLEYSRFERNEKKLKESSKQTALTIEKNYEHVGASGAEYYKKMADAIVAEHQRILNAAKYTSAEKVKAYSEATRMMRELNTQIMLDAERINKQNTANSQWQLAKMREQAAEESRIRKQAMVEEAERARYMEQINRNQIAREKAAFDARVAYQRRNAAAQSEASALYENFWAKKSAQEAAATEKSNKANAEWWMARMRYDKDVQKSGEQMWDTLGIRSKAWVAQQKQDATEAYKSLSAQAKQNGEDTTRLHQAYTNKLKAIDKEYANSHGSNIKGMIRNVLALYAAYYVLGNMARTVARFFVDGLEKADQMKKSAIAVAATIASQQGTENAVENYKTAYRYSSYLVEELRKVDKLSFANYEHILIMNRAMELQGVHLDVNKKKQVDAFTALTNAVALYTGEQDKQKQADQEMRSLFTGNIKMGSEVARIVDSLAKKSGKYVNGLKDIVRLGNEHGDTLERISEFLTGINAAAPDIANTWESATTSFETSWNRLKRLTAEALFPNAVNDLKSLSNALDDFTGRVILSFRGIHDRIMNTANSFVYLGGVVSSVFNKDDRKAWSEAYRELTTNMIESTRDLEMRMRGLTRITKDAQPGQFDLDTVIKVRDAFGQIIFYGKEIADLPGIKNAESELRNYQSMIRVIEKRREADKKTYQEATRNADMLMKISQKQGRFELDTIEETTKAKLASIETQKDNAFFWMYQEIAIAQEKAKKAGEFYDAEAEDAAKTATIMADYENKRQGVLDDRANRIEAVKDKIVSTEMELQMTIAKYSKDSYDAQIKDIERKSKAQSRFTSKDVQSQKLLQDALKKTKEQFTATFEAEKAGKKLDVYSMIAPYSKEAYQAFLDSIDTQAKLLDDSIISAADKEAWKTSKILDEIATRAEAQRAYYDDIKGFEGAAYDFTMERIEAIRQADIARGMDIKAANQKAYQSSMEAVERRYDAEHADILKVMGATEDMFGNAKALMKEDSDAYKLFHNAEMAMKAAQIAIEVQKQITIATSAAQEAAVFPMKMAMRKSLALAAGVEATVSAGTGDPYTAMARMAAMAAAVSGVLAIIGVGFSAFGGSGGSSTNPNAYNEGTGSLLGSSEASESAAKVYELLKDAHAMEYGKLVGIYNEVRDLNNNITGLVRGLLLGGDFSQMENVSGFEATFASKWTDTWVSAIDSLVGWTGLSSSWMSDLTNSMFGGKTDVSQIGAGLEISGATIGDILSGASAGIGQFFSDMKKVVDGGWFHSDKTTYWTIYEELDSGTNRLLTNVFANLGNTMLALAEGFGVDVTDQLMAMEIDLGKIDLMGKSGEEITDALTAAFSKYGDELVETLFGSIVTQYQKVDEGLLETAARLLLDKEQIMRMLDYTNQGFDTSIESAVALSESLIELAGDLDTLTDSFSAYYNAFFTDSEKALDEQNLLYESLTAVGLYLPSTRDGFRALVESLDLTTMSGQSAYVAMLSLAETADDYYSYVEDLQQEALDSMKDRVSDWESALRAIQNALGTFTEVTASSAIMAIDDIMAQTKLGILVSSNQLSAALSQATSITTAGYATGLSYDLDQAMIRASLLELGAATADQLSYDELRLSLMEGQNASLEELVALAQETNGLLSGEVTTVAGTLTSTSSTANLITEIRELKTLIKETGDVNSLYVKRLSDHLDDWDVAGLPETRA